MASRSPARSPSSRQRLAGRADQGLLDALHRSLRRRVERAQAVDLVAEKLDAHRPADVGRPDVHDAAPPAELPRRLDHRRALVAESDPTQQHSVQVEGLALAHRPEGQAHLAHGQSHLHQAARRCHGYRSEWRCRGRPRPRQQADEGFKPALAGFRGPRDSFVGQRVGVGEIVDGHFVGQPDAQLVDPLAGAHRSGSNDHQRPVEDARERGHDVGPGRAIHIQRGLGRLLRRQRFSQLINRRQPLPQVKQSVKFHYRTVGSALNEFIAASMPRLSHASIASIARTRASDISFSCSFENGIST